VAQNLHRRGTDLPYERLAGVVPCPKGWLVSPGKLAGINVYVEAPLVVSRLRDIIDEVPEYTVIAVATPIGLPGNEQPNGRACDREARQLLGWPRAGAVRSAPQKAVVTAKGYASAVRRNGGQLDVVSWQLLPRIVEATAEVQSHRQRTIFEVHPELSFHQLNGDRPLQHTKRSALGFDERRALLVKRLPSFELAETRGLPRSLQGHLLDATAALWTARRIAARAVMRLPEQPEWNAEGLRMEIVR
jgi:predicted RNase H-like nuclease